MESKSIENVIVVIPAYNEEKTISTVINDIKKRHSFDVIVVNDHSSDNTGEIASGSGAIVLSHPIRGGALCAIQTGIRYALKKGYDYVVTMDADGQHLADSINDVLKPVVYDEADVVIGSCIQRASWARRLAWVIFRLLSGVNIKDLTSGLRAYNRRAMRLVISRRALLYDYQDMGLLLYLIINGMRIREVEVNMLCRLDGHSRIFSSWLKVLEYLMQTLVISISKRLFKPKLVKERCLAIK